MAGRAEFGHRPVERALESREGPGLRLVSGEVYAGWESVYRDNVGWVYALMFGKVGNRPDAEDLTAEVFVAALRPLRVSASVPEVRAYLRATARTVLARYWRTRMGHEVTTIVDDLAEDPRQDSSGESAADAAAATRARNTLDRLPHRYRRVLELRFLDGLSVRDAAAALGVTVANAKVLQYRAVQMAAKLGEGGAR